MYDDERIANGGEAEEYASDFNLSHCA
jgi:hypothetical protein